MSWHAVLPPEEAEAVVGAVAKRRREFAAGRWCARAALAQLGYPVAALARRADRQAAWPDGVVGSITHTDSYCAAAVASKDTVAALGIDAEPAQPLPGDILSKVCSPAEMEHFGHLPPVPGGWPTMTFSAKESVYKAVHPLTGAQFDFSDVDVRFDVARQRFSARLDSYLDVGDVTLLGRFASGATHVFTTVVVRAGELASPTPDD